jgi:hypothetical protein
MTFNLPVRRNFGNEIHRLSPDLANQLDDMYSDIANALSLGIKKNILNGADPAASSQRNSVFSIGDIAVRTDTNRAWIMTSRTTANDVVWTLIT